MNVSQAKQEADKVLSGYIGSDILTNPFMQRAFQNDLDNLLSKWWSEGFLVKADGYSNLAFTGVDFEGGNVVMKYEQFNR